jgi:hypothetical protein
MIDLAYQLAADLEEYVTGLCHVNRVGVTYGEPAAPVGEKCREIWVWFDRFEDRRRFDEGCTTDTELTLNYRIYSCYPGDVTLTLEQHEEAAECFYSLIQAVWCGLVRGKDTGDLMLLGDCDRVRLGPLVASQPQGGTVSATGSVIVTFDCPLPSA